jgi:hypothetical protein
MAYIASNNGYTYGVKTLTDLISLTGMSTGDTAYCTTNNRIMTYDGTFWMCDDFVVMVNRLGVALNQWNIVIVQQGGTSTEISCTTTLTSGNPLVVGVVVYPAANGANCVIAIKGNYSVQVTGTVNLGDQLTTSATSGLAQKNTGGFSEGVFGYATTSAGSLGGLINCIIMPKKELN